MRVALNLLYLIPSVVGGTETYARSLLAALAAVDRDTEYRVFVNAEAAELDVTPAPNFRRVLCPVPGRRRPVRYAWEQTVLPAQLLWHGVDLLHSLGYVGPIYPPCPHVVTVHDLNYLRHADSMPATKRRLLRFFVEHTAARADHLLTVSQFSRAEIIAELPGVDPTAVTVTPNAARTLGGAPGGSESPATVARRYGLPGPYVAAFSSQSSHKNIPRLIEAFARVAPTVPHGLVLIGHQPADSSLRAAVDRHALGDRVRFTGYVPDADVPFLLRGADLFAFPSLYEGFGIPVLEAQAAGVPVACSSAASLPEVAGDAAVLFDPTSVDDMARALGACLTDAALRDRLRRAGLANVTRYSWEETARRTLAVYRRVAAARRDARRRP